MISVSRDTAGWEDGQLLSNAGADCGWDVTLYIVSWFGHGIRAVFLAT